MARFLHCDVLLLLVILLSLVLGVASNEDPCSVASVLHDASTRTRSSSASNSVCDIRLSSAWVRVSTGRGSDLVTSCPSLFAGCGTSFPVWLNGTIPDVSEGEVTRRACVTSLNSSCEQVLTVGVKNCGDFRVWRLPPTLSCPQAYCFEDPPSTTSTTTNFPGPLPPQDDPHHHDHDDHDEVDDHNVNNVNNNNNANHGSHVLDKDSLEGWEAERRARVLETAVGVVSFLLLASLVLNGVLLYKCCTRKRNLTYSKDQEAFQAPMKTAPPCTPPPPYAAKHPIKVDAWEEKKELPRY